MYLRKLSLFKIFYCYYLATHVSSCQLLSCNLSNLFWAILLYMGVPLSQPAPAHALATGSKRRYYLRKTASRSKYLLSYINR